MKTNISHLGPLSFWNVATLRCLTLQSVGQHRGMFRHFVCTALREGTLQINTPDAILRDAVRIIHEGILYFQMSYGLAMHA
jgi:hypothetical protein